MRKENWKTEASPASSYAAALALTQLLSRVRLFVTPRTAARQASLSFTISLSLLKLMSTESVMPTQPSHPMPPPSLPAFNLSQHQGLFQ